VGSQGVTGAQEIRRSRKKTNRRSRDQEIKRLGSKDRDQEIGIKRSGSRDRDRKIGIKKIGRPEDREFRGTRSKGLIMVAASALFPAQRDRRS
jgi:hypothetical protein